MLYLFMMADSSLHLTWFLQKAIYKFLDTVNVFLSLPFPFHTVFSSEVLILKYHYLLGLFSKIPGDSSFLSPCALPPELFPLLGNLLSAWGHPEMFPPPPLPLPLAQGRGLVGRGLVSRLCWMCLGWKVCFLLSLSPSTSQHRSWVLTL